MWLDDNPRGATTRATPLNRHEAARIASAGIASYAARTDAPLSYDAMGEAAVDALVALAALAVVDTDDVAAQRREDAEYYALDRDQADDAPAAG